MDVNIKVEIEEEYLESPQDTRNNGQNFEQDAGLQKIQKQIFSSNVDIKEEIEIKDEVVYVNEEFKDSEEHMEHIFGLDESQALISDVNNEEKGDTCKMINSLRAEPPQTSEIRPNQEICKKNLRNLSWSCCNFNFVSKDELKSHLKLAHTNSKFKCSEVSYECNQEGSLKAYMLTHPNFTLFKCSKCSYDCNRKGDLNKHMLIHSDLKVKGKSGRKLFKCSECSYDCKHKARLKTHMILHAMARNNGIE